MNKFAKFFLALLALVLVFWLFSRFDYGRPIVAYFNYDTSKLAQIVKDNNLTGAVVEKVYYPDTGKVVFINGDNNEISLFNAYLFSTCDGAPFCNYKDGFTSEYQLPIARLGISPDKRLVFDAGTIQGVDMYGQEYKQVSSHPVFADISNITKLKIASPYWDKLGSLNGQNLSDYYDYFQTNSMHFEDSSNGKWNIEQNSYSVSIGAEDGPQTTANYQKVWSASAQTRTDTEGHLFYLETVGDVAWLPDSSGFIFSVFDNNPTGLAGDISKTDFYLYDLNAKTAKQIGSYGASSKPRLIDVISKNKLVIYLPDGTYQIDLSSGSVVLTKLLSQYIKLVGIVP